jgi:RNA polymerase sigma factor (sigma-70 family)
VDAASEKAWQAFCAARTRRLVASLRQHYRLQVADVEDLLQEVWAKAVKELPGLEGGGGPAVLAAWLEKVLRTTATDLLRDKARRRAQSVGDLRGTQQEPVARDSDPEAAAKRLAEAERVRAGLERRRGSARLNDRVLVLRVLDGRSTKEVAEELHLPEDNVRDRLRRGKRNFRQSQPICSERRAGREG